MKSNHKASSSLNFSKKNKKQYVPPRKSASSYNTDDEENEQLVKIARTFVDDSGSGFSSVNNYSNVELVSSGEDDKKNVEQEFNVDGDVDSVDSNIDDILRYSIDDIPNEQVDINHINRELQDLQKRIENSSLKNQSTFQITSPKLEPIQTQKTSSKVDKYSSSGMNVSKTPDLPKSPYVPAYNEEPDQQISSSEAQYFEKKKETPNINFQYELQNEKRLYEKKILDLERKIAELEERLTVSENNEQQTKESFENEAELVNQLRDINARLTSAISSQTYQIGALEQELRGQIESNTHQQQLINRLETKITDLNNSHVQEILELKRKLHRAIQEIKKQRTQIENIKKEEVQQLKQFSNQIEQMSEENTNLRKQLIEANKERSALELERDSKNEQLIRLQEEFKQFEEEFKKVKFKYDEFTQMHSGMEEKKSINRLSQSTPTRKRPQSASAATTRKATVKSPNSSLTTSKSPTHSQQTKDDILKKKKPVVSKVRVEEDKFVAIRLKNDGRKHEKHDSVLSEEEEQTDVELIESEKQKYLEIPFYKDTRYLKQKLLTERKRVELKNIEIAGLKELLYKSQLRSKEKTKSELKKRINEELQRSTKKVHQ